MLNRIIRFSLRNRLIVLVAAVLLMFVGIYTSSKMEVDVFPDLNAPTVVVMTEANGMAPEEVERLVTFPVETALNGATDVRRVRSSSTTGFSVVWVEFEWGTDIYRARQIVSEKLAAASSLLPEGVGSPTLGPQSSILGELMTVSLTSDTTSLRDLRTLADWTIRPRLLATGGVAQVSVLGGEVKEYQILLSPEKMRHYGVTLSEVAEAVGDMNRNVSGGILYEYGNEYIIRGMLSTQDTKQIASSLVKRTDNGTPITLADIAEVKGGDHAPKTGVASYNGHPSVVLTVTKQPNISTIELTEKIDIALDELRHQLPTNIEIHSDVYRQSRFIESSVNNVRQALIEGAVFVVVILFLFLANVRTTIISLVTIPIALLTSILVLHLLGLTINTMSLGGLCIAIGSLVDDAIVDVENVYKRLRENSSLPAAQRKSALDIIFKASSEVRMPILNSTLIIVASFAPLFFLSGMEGRMLVPLGIAFITALASSTVVALTLTPVLCSYLLGKEKKSTQTSAKESLLSRRLKSAYLFLLNKALGHSRLVLTGTAAALILAITLFAGMGSSFLPSFNEGSFTINVSTLPGVSLEESDRIGSMAEKALMSIPEIQAVGRKTGRAELDEHALGINTSEIEAPFVLGDRSKDEVVADVRKKLSAIPGINIEVGSPISHRIDAMLSGTRASIAIKIFGPDLNKLFALGNDIRKQISGVEGIADLNVEQQVERPQLTITPRRSMMARYGVTMAEFGQIVNTLLAGETVSQVYEGDRSFDLVLKVDDNHRRGMADLRTLMVDTKQGEVPLSAIADISSTAGPNTINRENVTRKVVVSANVSGRDLRGVVTDIQDIVAERISLPEDYHIEYGGQFESQETAMRTLLVVSALSLIVILLLLWSQFRSIRQSALILLNLPLSLIGGVIAIWLTGGVISIPSIIGFISLFGIATRNGMLLVARYNDLTRAGLTLRDSVLIGSADRLNPILMTALTSALALIPMVIGSDLPGNEIQSPMAVVILGGLITSTILNGFIIPIIYLMATPATPAILSTAKRPTSPHMLPLILIFLLCPLSLCAQDYTQALSSIERNNTTLSALSSRAEAERLSNRADTYLDAPELGFNYLWGHPSDIGKRHDISVSQPLSIATLTGQRHRVASGLDAIVDTRLSLDRMSILLEAKNLLIDMVYYNAMLRQMATRIDAAATVADMQRQRLDSGDGTRLDLNNALMSLSTLRADSLRLSSERAITSAQLTRLNGGQPLSFEAAAFDDLALPADFDQWYATITDHQPEIELASRQTELSARQLSLAKTDRLPDITIGYMSENTSGERYQGVTLGISIPLWNSRNKVRQARANIQASRAEQADAVLQQRSRMESLFHQAETLHSLAMLYSRTLSECSNMPLSAQALQAGEISQVDYLLQASAYYDAYDQWLTAQRDYHKAHSILHAYELK